MRGRGRGRGREGERERGREGERGRERKDELKTKGGLTRRLHYFIASCVLTTATCASMGPDPSASIKRLR